MTSMFSFLLVFLAILFWLFRFVVAFTYSMDIDIGFQPINMNVEIIILFVSVICIIFAIKRNLLVTVIYLAIHISYYGKELYDVFMRISSSGANISNMSNVLVCVVGIAIPLFMVFDIILNKGGNGSNMKKTNWFYNNEAYDRKYDERADKNNYKL